VTSPGAASTALGTAVTGTDLPGMPPPLDPRDVWAADRPGLLSSAVSGMTTRVNVPNSISNTVTVIDPGSLRVEKTVRVGKQPQHVVPSWDLRTLWVNSDLGNSLTPIDPRTGAFGRPVAVRDPYNLCFTPDKLRASLTPIFGEEHGVANVRKCWPMTRISALTAMHGSSTGGSACGAAIDCDM
jgi:YVTN family beta-propeller protein